MKQKVKTHDRLEVGLRIQFPDVNKGLSYTAKERQIKLEIDGKPVCTYDMDSASQVDLRVRLRAVVTARNIFKKNSGDDVDMVQKYIVGQNFIEVTFPRSGKVRRKSVSFQNMNVLNLLQPQDFWK